ncbi:MAG: SPOR domain-containing protein [Pseudarcicella sp.]|nr:SPOR domain-containing protein [Pseudarcicella sp.]MBP6409745.1 SPOR domain-containing protein [Pseudarcicella sp.]
MIDSGKTFYQKDLSKYRNLQKPTEAYYELQDSLSAQPSKIKLNNDNGRVDSLLDSITEQIKNIKFANGFRIQIYVGNEKTMADEAKVFIYKNYPEIDPYMYFNVPIYKIKVGDFLKRTQAEQYLYKLKEAFPAAIILPDKVEIKKGLLVK